MAQLAQERGIQVADFNTPMTEVLKTLNEESHDLAQKLIPDHVHPQQAGHWIMAESMLKAWNAPSLVTSVIIDAGPKPSVDAKNTDVIDFSRARGEITSKISWTQSDKALPLPFPPAEVDPVVGLVLKDSDILAALDQETLQVHNLSAGSYDLQIDGRKIGSFTAEQLTTGINLATMDTPMLEQARLVALDTEKANGLEATRFGIINASVTAEQSEAAKTLADEYTQEVERQHAGAQPHSHHYDLVLLNTPPRAQVVRHKETFYPSGWTH